MPAPMTTSATPADNFVLLAAPELSLSPAVKPLIPAARSTSPGEPEAASEPLAWGASVAAEATPVEAEAGSEVLVEDAPGEAKDGPGPQ